MNEPPIIEVGVVVHCKEYTSKKLYHIVLMSHSLSLTGGRIAIGVAMFQACLLVVLIIGFILSRFAPHMLGDRSFFNVSNNCTYYDMHDFDIPTRY